MEDISSPTTSEFDWTLPLELWELIIARSNFDTVTRFSMTCKLWRQTAYGHIKKIDFAYCSVKMEGDVHPNWHLIGEKCTQLRELRGNGALASEDVHLLTKLTQLEDFDFRNIHGPGGFKVNTLRYLTFLVDLQHLNLSWMRDVKDEDITQLIKSLTSIRRITLSGLGGITSPTLEAFTGLHKLTRLGLYGCVGFGENLFLHLSKTVPQLKHLSVRSVSTLTKKSFQHLALCSNLTHLSLRNTKFDDASAQHLTSLSKLEHLSLASTYISGPGLTSLQALKNSLRVLDVIWCDSLKFIPYLGELKLLEIFKADASGSIDRTTWLQVESLTNLKHLDVANCALQPDVVQGWSVLKKLEYLDIGGNGELTSDDIVATFGDMPNLRRLRLEGITKTPAVVQLLKRVYHTSLLRGEIWSLADIGIPAEDGTIDTMEQDGQPEAQHAAN